MVLYTIWHEKVNGSGFHSKGKICIFKDFKVKFLVEELFHILGNHDFWNLLILKYYLSIGTFKTSRLTSECGL